MKILLTGATGFIGSHVARELLGRGHEVHCTLRSGSSRRRILDIERRLHIHYGLIDSIPIQADLAIHLAWHTVPNNYLTAPENEECLDGSLRLLSGLFCRTVFVGTCFELDTSLGVLREDSPTKPATLYSRCKDHLRREVVKKSNAAWVRLFYQYGPWEDDRRMVPTAIRCSLTGQMIKGSPGEQKRDYMHVEDVAAAICSVATSRLTGTVNIGSGNPVSIREILTRIGDLSGRPHLVWLGALPYYEGEPMLISADNSKLLSTGWMPKYDIATGLRQTFEWWRKKLTSGE